MFLLDFVLCFCLFSLCTFVNLYQLSAEAQRAGASDMTLDEINAEIDAARSG